VSIPGRCLAQEGQKALEDCSLPISLRSTVPAGSVVTRSLTALSLPNPAHVHHRGSQFTHYRGFHAELSYRCRESLTTNGELTDGTFRVFATYRRYNNQYQLAVWRYGRWTNRQILKSRVFLPNPVRPAGQFFLAGHQRIPFEQRHSQSLPLPDKKCHGPDRDKRCRARTRRSYHSQPG